MTKANQKILYDHFKSIADNVKKDKGNKDFKPIVRENCKRYASDILESFPEFSKSKEKK